MISDFVGIIIVIVTVFLFVVGSIIYLIRRRSIANKVKIPDAVRTPLEVLSDLQTWQISERKPSKLLHPAKDYIQVVLLSKVTGMKSFWAEYDGVGIIRTKNRAYKIPKENVYGNVFIWDIDKKESINKLISVGKQDAEDSFHMLQTFNMAYSVGRQAGATDLLNKIGLVTILLIIILVADIAIGYLLYSGFGNLTKQFESAKAVIEAYAAAHPTGAT